MVVALLAHLWAVVLWAKSVCVASGGSQCPSPCHLSLLSVLADVEGFSRPHRVHHPGRQRRRRLGDRPRLRGESPVPLLSFPESDSPGARCGGSRVPALRPGRGAHACLFQNDVSEKEQRWGAKTVRGSGHQEHIE